MIERIDDLESVALSELKALCRKLDADTIAIARHGISPDLSAKFGKALPLLLKIKVRFSPYRKTSVKMELVEQAHRKIVEQFNALRR